MYVLLGCVVTEASQAPESLYICTFDPRTESLTIVNGIQAMPKTAYLVTDAKQRLVFAVGSEEGQAGVAASYRFDAERNLLAPLNRRSTLGTNPNYASLSSNGRVLYTVNFAGGSISLLPVQESGQLEDVTQHIRYEGSGPVPGAQAGPHPHSIVPHPTGPYVVITDLGTDRIHVYKLDEAGGRLQEHSQLSAAPGSGPRHFIFHDTRPMAYLIYELSNEIGVFTFDRQEGTLVLKQTVPTLPGDFLGKSKCADLKLSPCGRFLYGTNRGHDSIVIYGIDEDGLLRYSAHTSSYGRKPRSIAFTPDGSHLLAANEGSHDVAVFAVDPCSGELEFRRKLELANSPINVTFMA